MFRLKKNKLTKNKTYRIMAVNRQNFMKNPGTNRVIAEWQV
jgi:hypothetical protein